MTRFALALGALCCAALPGPAAAQAVQQACGVRDEIVAKLAQEFKENQQAVGVVDENAVLEVFVSDNGGSWTIIATGTDGNSCVLSAGQDWESKDFVKGLDTSLRSPASAGPARDLPDL